MSYCAIGMKRAMQAARMAASLLLSLTACGNAPPMQACDGQACFQALPGSGIGETVDAGGANDVGANGVGANGVGANGVGANGIGFDGAQAGLLPDEPGFDPAAAAPPPIPAAGTPTLPGPPDLDRLLLPSFGESLFDFFVAGMLLGPDGLDGGGFGDGGSLLFGDEPSTATSSQRPYLEELCRRLGQSDFACRQRYGE